MHAPATLVSRTKLAATCAWSVQQGCALQQLSKQAHLDSPLDIKGAGAAGEVHVQRDVVVGSPGAQVVLDGGRLGSARLPYKEARPTSPDSGVEQP